MVVPVDSHSLPKHEKHHACTVLYRGSVEAAAAAHACTSTGTSMSSFFFSSQLSLEKGHNGVSPLD